MLASLRRVYDGDDNGPERRRNMTTETVEVSSGPVALGQVLKAARTKLGLSLRGVEEVTGQEISNAYLSQLENGKITKPGPQLLYTLAELYRISYENLMEIAGYVAPANKSREAGVKHGNAATFSIDYLSKEEEMELLKYLAYFRAHRNES
jgi:HTH-type transcriptional regulator, competence development regulator